MSSSIVPAEQFSALANIESASEVLSTNLGDEGLAVHNLPQITVPSGGATSWTIQTLEGETDTKEIEAIIVHKQPRRVLFLQSFDDNPGQAPDCYSDDGKTGRATEGVNPIVVTNKETGDDLEVTVGGDCKTCFMAQWGSDLKGGKGQACNARNHLFLLMGDQMLPTILDLPPSSIKALQNYMIRLASAGLSFYDVVTKMTLNRVESGKGIKYSEVAFAVAARLGDDAKGPVRAYREAILPAIQG